MTEQAEMPRYKCHKQVWALKIAKLDYTADILTGEPTATITPAEHAGDGYQSYPPAKAFDEGYTRI